MPLEDKKLNGFTFNHAEQQDALYEVKTSAQVKADFDSRAEEVRVVLNSLIDQLQSDVDGDSGADSINLTSISGLTGTTVQTVLESLKQQIDDVVLGEIPDGSITPIKLSVDAKKAENINVADIAGLFTATNVEGVLEELFTFADDGKTNIATVVGSPATVDNTFSQLQTHIQNSKNTLATNLTDKGQTSAGTEPLQALADKVANVNTGKRYLTGTATSSATTVTFKSGNNINNNTNHVTVTGLTFQPSKINIYKADGSQVTKFDATSPNDVKIDLTDARTTGTPAASTFLLDGVGAYVTPTSFRMPTYYASAAHTWEIVE